MKVFTVHHRIAGGGRAADLVLIKEGFCGPAFFFGFLWPLAHRMWGVAAFFLVAQISGQAVAAVLGLGASGHAVLGGACTVALAYLANDLRRAALWRRGYRERSVVLGRSASDGFRRYLDRAPNDILMALP